MCMSVISKTVDYTPEDTQRENDKHTLTCMKRKWNTFESQAMLKGRGLNTRSYVKGNKANDADDKKILHAFECHSFKGCRSRNLYT